MNKQKIYIGIDTSNYTTSIGVCNDKGEIIANIKKLLNVKEGERGLRQSDAVFAHVKNFPLLAPQLAEVIENCDVLTSIPMYGKVNSFNVSTAASVILCEAARQNRGK